MNEYEHISTDDLKTYRKQINSFMQDCLMGLSNEGGATTQDALDLLEILFDEINEELKMRGQLA
jgi:hypothetical protein